MLLLLAPIRRKRRTLGVETPFVGSNPFASRFSPDWGGSEGVLGSIRPNLSALAPAMVV